MTISSFDLTVCLGVIDEGVIELDAQVSTPFVHFVAYKIGAVICDDVVWDTITVYDTGYKVYHWPGFGRLTGLASIHLENLSTMTNRYFFLWLPPLRGPTISSPQTAKGQVMRIVCKAVGGIWL